MMALAFAISVAASILLAAVESALISVSRVRARHAAEEGDTKAARLVALLEYRQELLRVAMVAHHLFSIAAFAIVALESRRAMGNWGIAVATILLAPAFLILLELAPKSFSRLFPFRILRLLTLVLSFLKLLSQPWRIIAARIGPAEVPAEPAPPQDGVADLTRTIIGLKLLPENAALLLGRYAAFAKLNAADLGLPMNVLGAVPADLPLESALQLAAQKSQRFHPVLDPQGELIGFLDAASLSLDMPPGRVVRQFTLSLPHVSPKYDALRCIQILRTSATPFAAVMDEQGHCTGILRLESVFDRLLNLSEKPKAAAKSGADMM